ncbi:hypothetical protein HPB51_016198 [Rhipicephalus microplus]|uniref:Uncharacterized protein n=1 Tax=Rhipicephalus microplus TaxID=6941 RepID=A0A9J6E1D1_RHIMP|nr:hypothetical protein HPB51_016198 [Rhipicephalus microplus]
MSLCVNAKRSYLELTIPPDKRMRRLGSIGGIGPSHCSTEGGPCVIPVLGGGEVYLAGAESLNESPAERERLVLQCRYMAAKHSGFVHLDDSDILPQATPEDTCEPIGNMDDEVNDTCFDSFLPSSIQILDYVAIDYHVVIAGSLTDDDILLITVPMMTAWMSRRDVVAPCRRPPKPSLSSRSSAFVFAQ